MTATTDTRADDQALKAKHRAIWALGDYPSVATDVIPDLGRVLVDACGLDRRHKVLDVAAGAGNASIPAAEAGASVVACDLTPELLAVGRSRAAELPIEWHEADAEQLPYDDDSFDTVISCVGVMFAPHHQTSADELLRVCRPGGTIGLVNWTPEGFVGQLFATMKPYAPPPPPGTQPPPLWGKEEYVLSLLGDRVTDVGMQRQHVTVSCFDRPEAFRDYFKARYGPTVAAYRGIADDPDRVAALDRDLADLARRHDQGSDSTVMDWEYLLFTARKR